MTAIKEDFGRGGANTVPSGAQGEPTLAETLRDIADDLANLRASLVALTAKIDADSGDTGGDSDYAATCDPPALETTKV